MNSHEPQPREQAGDGVDPVTGIRFTRRPDKRHVDLQIISEWIGAGSRVLDLGCGRGILLERLRQTRGVYGVGVDSEPAKVAGCVKRGVNVYQGDAEKVLAEFPDRFFDWVVLSRTIQELGNPARVIGEALRVGRRMAVGFVNFGFWENRVTIAREGHRIRNEVYPDPWEHSFPVNPVSIAEFERFCGEAGITLHHRVYLGADWQTEIHEDANLLAGYALYELGKG